MSGICAGCTILIVDRPKSHLWIVLTDPTPHPEHVLAVMIVTRKLHSDTTTVLQLGDHPFIKHASCVLYSTARTFSVTTLNEWLAEGDAQFKLSVSPELLTRIRKGLIDSDFTVNAIREYFRTEFS